MEGSILSSLINYLDKYHSQVTVLLIGFAVIILAVLIWVWFYNRRKYHHLKHQIPASVVNTYLDSIIQNSNALKSSLFRGGGLDVDPKSIPSVLPLSDLAGGGSVQVSGDDSQLRAEISRLNAALAERNNIIKDLENKNVDLEGTVKAKQERIEELEKLLAQLQAGGASEGGADPAVVAELTKERDELKEKLQEYDLISDDISELGRLRQENEQLKNSLGEGGATPAAPVEEPASEEPAAEEPAAEEPAAEEPAAEEPAAEVPAAEEPAAEEPAKQEPVEAQAANEEASEDKEDGDNKSPEDLLSEFEKMLG